ETEIHPVTFLAVARTEGDATVARVFFNPYHVTQVYSPDPAVPGRVEDRSRFADPAVKTFPSYLVDDVVRLLQQTKDHLGAGGLIGWLPRSLRHRVTDPTRVFPLIGTLSVAWR